MVDVEMLNAEIVKKAEALVDKSERVGGSPLLHALIDAVDDKRAAMKPKPAPMTGEEGVKFIGDWYDCEKVRKDTERLLRESRRRDWVLIEHTIGEYEAGYSDSEAAQRELELIKRIKAMVKSALDGRSA